MTKAEAYTFIAAQIRCDGACMSSVDEPMRVFLEKRIEANQIALNAIEESNMWEGANA